MKCHYVPQFYLKNFSVQERAGYVYAYRRNGESFNVKTENIAAKNDMYLFKDKNTGEESDEVERIFSQLESLIAPVISKIILKKKIELTEEQRVVLSEFISYLRTRNLAFRKTQKGILTKLFSLQLKSQAKDKNRWEKHVKEVLGGKRIEDLDLEKLRSDAVNFDNKFVVDYGNKNDDFFLKYALLVGKSLVPFVFEKRWHLVECISSRKFITSDNPVSVIKSDYSPKSRGAGLSNGYLLVPLSPDTAILMSNGKRALPEKIKAGRDMVDYFNKHTMFFAHKFIFSNFASKEFKNQFSKTEEGNKIIMR
jgi:hypothetical protein